MEEPTIFLGGRIEEKEEWEATPTLELVSDVNGHGSGEVGDVAEGGLGEGWKQMWSMVPRSGCVPSSTSGHRGRLAPLPPLTTAQLLSCRSPSLAWLPPVRSALRLLCPPLACSARSASPATLLTAAPLYPPSTRLPPSRGEREDREKREES
uniref:Uncharacterized protein n=1 Tax=Oryza punctata TaxID=4537 RepID=A0A0E0M6R1_ORYPU